MSGGVDWDALMRAGLGALRLSPEVFWCMTPRELSRALEGAGLVPGPASALRHDDLEALMKEFPDGKGRRDE